MDYTDKILQLSKVNPLLPTETAKAIGTNTILASAILSELASKGLLKVSNLKVGSSPLYYPPNDGYKLQNYAKHLNEQDRRTVEILKNERVLRDSELDPLTRVSLRQIKDFSIPLEVIFNDKKEIFWQWYLLKEAEAEDLIKKKLNIQEKKPVEEQKHEEIIQKLEKKQIKKKRIKKVVTKEHSPDMLENYFLENNINIIEKLAFRKNNCAFIIQINSSLGLLSYYSEAVFKSRISERDLNNAFVNGQLRKLPVIFLTNGELTKKAQEILKELKGMNFKKLDLHGS